MNNIEHLYYINLDKRTDRNEHVLSNVIPFFDCADKYTRISGVDMTHELCRHKRAIGCAKSHLHAYELFMRSEHNMVLIVEDDFTPTVTKDVFRSRFKVLVDNFPNFSVCNVAYNTDGYVLRNIQDDVIFRCNNVQTTSCYLITRRLIHELHRVVSRGVDNLENGGQSRPNAIDQAWKSLQTEDNEWVVIGRCGKQLSDYSDIERRKVSYDC